jgi:hypothetical protein
MVIAKAPFRHREAEGRGDPEHRLDCRAPLAMTGEVLAMMGDVFAMSAMVKAMGAG